MLDAYSKALQEKNVLNGEIPKIVMELTEAITNERIPLKMKVTTVLSEIATFASQFRRNMWHWEGFELPVNSLAVIIAGSGVGKDSAVKAVRRVFSSSYDIINAKREELAISQAMLLATESGESNPTDEAVYNEYKTDPAPIYLAPTTPQGFIQHINDIGDLPVGSGSLYTGEFGDELASSPHMLELIKTIAETYDTGDKEMVYTKGKEFRSKEIKAMPISALLISSPTYILYDEGVKRKFLIAFGSKLARRVQFCFVPKMLPKRDFTLEDNPILAKLEHTKAELSKAKLAKEHLSPMLEAIVAHHLPHAGEFLNIDEEVFDLFTIYQGYNEAFAETMSGKAPLSRLVREHLQWKALKLAGALAIFKCHNTVQEEDLIDAIRICELLDSDMALFEAELVKEPYEIFADYMKEISLQGTSILDLHELRKHKFIPSNGDATRRMKDLIQLAAAYDKEATYELDGDAIRYNRVLKTDKVHVSFKPIDNSGIYAIIEAGGTHEELSEAKGKVASTANYGLEIGETVFADLSGLLESDMSYSPFVFEGGRRKKENIRGGAKWLVFDIDNSEITAEECHVLLSHINHHIALSSNPDNSFKFRVLLELDSIVDTDGLTWMNFYLAVAEEIGLTVDPLPQSAIFFSYTNGDREIMSVTDAEPLQVRDFMMVATEKASKAPVGKNLTNPQKSARLQDERETFNAAFEAQNGNGSIKLIWAAKHAYNDLGADKDYVIALIKRINAYWRSPLEDDRLELTIISQIRRWP